MVYISFILHASCCFLLTLINFILTIYHTLVLLVSAMNKTVISRRSFRSDLPLSLALFRTAALDTTQYITCE